MQVEIWSDVVCPWCYIGRRRFACALELFAHRDDVEIVWRSFRLDPTAPASSSESSAQRLAGRYRISVEEAERRLASVTAVAAAEGLEYHFESVRHGNSLDAHRVLHLAQQSTLRPRLEERLMRAHFTEGEAIADPRVLERLAGQVGLDPQAIARVLDSDEFGEAVLADEQRARSFGARAVPFVVVGGRYPVSGAQDKSRYLQVLDIAWMDDHRLQPTRR